MTYIENLEPVDRLRLDLLRVCVEEVVRTAVLMHDATCELELALGKLTGKNQDEELSPGDDQVLGELSALCDEKDIAFDHPVVDEMLRQLAASRPELARLLTPRPTPGVDDNGDE